LVQSWLFHCYCLTMALYFGSKLTVSLLLSYDGLVFWFKAACLIIIVLWWLCILVQSCSLCYVGKTMRVRSYMIRNIIIHIISSTKEHMTCTMT
jgi:hypothetical protein